MPQFIKYIKLKINKNINFIKKIIIIHKKNSKNR